MVKQCIISIYSKVFDGATFPFASEIGDEIKVFKRRRNNRESA